MQHPKVSIVTPTYNRPDYLREAIESVLSQTYPNIEIIVVNDGSTHNIEAVLTPYMKHIDHYIKRPNGGCAAAKNTGLSAATGEFITNLDDDDRILPEKIERQVEMFLSRPQIGICATGATYINEHGEAFGTYVPPQLKRKTQTLQFLRRCLLTQSSVMIRRKVHNHLGGYKLVWGEDYDMWLRASLHYEFGVIPDLLTQYRIHGDQMTGPANESKLNSDVKKVIQDFLAQTPIHRIIPRLRDESEGHVIIGMVLSHQKLYDQAKAHFARVLPHPAARLGLGLIKFLELELDQAESYFKQVEVADDSQLASKAKEVGAMLDRAREAMQKPKISNNSKLIVGLRKDLSAFRAALIRERLHFATGGKTK